MISAAPSPPAAPLALTGFLPSRDVERRRADLAPVTAWALDRSRRLGHPVASLDTLHHHVDAARALALAQALTAESPTEELRRHEWDEAVAALAAERLGARQVWEWTSTPHDDGGRVVRDGRWRDQATLPARPENRSFAVSPAPDLGFRCVADR